MASFYLKSHAGRAAVAALVVSFVAVGCFPVAAEFDAATSITAAPPGEIVVTTTVPTRVRAYLTNVSKDGVVYTTGGGCDENGVCSEPSVASRGDYSSAPPGSVGEAGWSVVSTAPVVSDLVVARSEKTEIVSSEVSLDADNNTVCETVKKVSVFTQREATFSVTFSADAHASETGGEPPVSVTYATTSLRRYDMRNYVENKWTNQLNISVTPASVSSAFGGADLVGDVYIKVEPAVRADPPLESVTFDGASTAILSAEIVSARVYVGKPTTVGAGKTTPDSQVLAYDALLTSMRGYYKAGTNLYYAPYTLLAAPVFLRTHSNVSVSAAPAVTTSSVAVSDKFGQTLPDAVFTADDALLERPSSGYVRLSQRVDPVVTETYNRIRGENKWVFLNDVFTATASPSAVATATTGVKSSFDVERLANVTYSDVDVVYDVSVSFVEIEEWTVTDEAVTHDADGVELSYDDTLDLKDVLGAKYPSPAEASGSDAPSGGNATDFEEDFQTEPVPAGGSEPVLPDTAVDYTYVWVVVGVVAAVFAVAVIRLFVKKSGKPKGTKSRSGRYVGHRVAPKTA